MAAAGADGAIAPSLDALAPDAERVREAVAEGVGTMPAFPQLSADELDALSAYVAEATRP